jgi:hypothetical protein
MDKVRQAISDHLYPSPSPHADKESFLSAIAL